MDKDKIRELLKRDQYGKRKTLQEVGDMFGVSREYIRQINGNVGQWKSESIELLTEQREEWGYRLYRKEDITLEGVAKLFGIRKCLVLEIVGKRYDYDKEHGERKCVTCGKAKPIDEFYTIGENHQRECAKCNNERVTVYQREHKERVAENARKRRAENPEYYRAYYREYKKKHTAKKT